MSKTNYRREAQEVLMKGIGWERVPAEGSDERIGTSTQDLGEKWGKSSGGIGKTRAGSTQVVPVLHTPRTLHRF